MKIIVCKDYAEMSKKATEMVAALVKSKPDCTLGLATGSTPEGLYAGLVEKYESGEISFAKVNTVNLDEYYPIDPKNDQSYRYFMNQKLFDHIDINKNNTHVPNGLAKDVEKECAEYDELVKKLGVDIQILGIGRNGHIGFNEPDTYLVPGTHVTDLTQNTIEANSRFFASADEVPKKALTMGIGSILSAKQIIMLVSGANKKEAVAKLLTGNLYTDCPATMINLHDDVTLIVTEDAYR
ncbi:MAG: glucosamine-6-phosphate deaminase [Ruminococcaceae bacterium]|nr:glucosamine-6-phosphate deaminase [Oscillospiraceae bacterium]